MFLADLIDIYDHHQVEESDSLSDNKFIVKQHGDDVQLGYVEYDATIHTGEVRYNYVDGEYIEAANGKYVYVYSPTTFVKDSNGKYIKSPIEFKDVNRVRAGKRQPRSAGSCGCINIQKPRGKRQRVLLGRHGLSQQRNALHVLICQ